MGLWIFGSIFSLMTKSKINNLLIDNKFFSLAIDQGTSLKNIIKEKKEDFVEKDYFNFKKHIILNIADCVSSILFDYQMFDSDDIFKKLKVPKIIAYEDDAYNIDNLDMITKLPTNNFDDKLNEFSALKFFMYFNPDSNIEINNKKKILISKVGKICSENNIPFLFEPLLYFDESIGYNLKDYYKKKPEYISFFYNEFSKLDYLVDIIKIEFPFNEFEIKEFDNGNSNFSYSMKDCEKLLQDTFSQSTTPFVFLSAGMKFNNFYNSLCLAKSSNINFLGFLCGRSLWYDSINIFANSNHQLFIDWIKTEGIRRINKLKSAI